MSLDTNTIAALAEKLENAELNRAPITKLTEAHPTIDWSDAYAVQHAIRKRHT